ncbi:MAG: AAA family ATPase [Candidatus Micrarchaeota archaeon]
METEIFSKIALESERKIIEGMEIKRIRDLYAKIKTSGSNEHSERIDYYTGIIGLRGIGKTTLLLQLARNYDNPLYFSADAIYLRNFSIYDVVNYAEKNGYSSFFIDEIHYSKDWTYSLKTLYDEGINNVFFSGSSAIDLMKGADLSRRAILFRLPPATFREYLNIKHGFDFPILSLNEILEKKTELTNKCMSAYSYFKEYLEYGGFLYERKEFDSKLVNSINKLASVDLAYLRDINMNVENDVIRLYNIVSSLPSFELNYSRLASSLNITKTTAMRLVSDLAKAGGIIICNPCRSGYAAVRNEPKLFLPIPLTSFFSRQLGRTAPIGRLREEFFISHTKDACYLKTERGAKTSDFKSNNVIFEIGGISKSVVQNPDYLVLDGLECFENRIPLFLFGFLSY